jgi:hypothetical protein
VARIVRLKTCNRSLIVTRVKAWTVTRCERQKVFIYVLMLIGCQKKAFSSVSVIGFHSATRDQSSMLIADCQKLSTKLQLKRRYQDGTYISNGDVSKTSPLLEAGPADPHSRVQTSPHSRELEIATAYPPRTIYPTHSALTCSWGKLLNPTGVVKPKRYLSSSSVDHPGTTERLSGLSVTLPSISP